MSPEQVFAGLQEAVAIVLEVPAASVLPEQRFAEDLAADSLALVEIIDILEERLPIRMKDEDLDGLLTIQAVVDHVCATWSDHS